MAALSKLEINFKRLLERCEAMAEEIQDNKENSNWRLEKVFLRRRSKMSTRGIATLTANQTVPQ